MSCHAIGHGVSFILEKVAGYYKNGEISKEVFKKMIEEFPDTVHWFDGNEYEATDYIDNNICCECFHFYEDGEKFVIAYDVDNDIREEWDNKIKNKEIKCYSLCLNCFKKIFGFEPNEGNMTTYNSQRNKRFYIF